MSVDWLNCKSCGENFPDCGDFVSCGCGEHWCSEECAEDDGFERETCTLGYDTEDNECENSCYDCDNFLERSCNYCRQEDFEDEILLDYALQLLGMNRENLIKRYKNK